MRVVVDQEKDRNEYSTDRYPDVASIKLRYDVRRWFRQLGKASKGSLWRPFTVGCDSKT